MAHTATSDPPGKRLDEPAASLSLQRLQRGEISLDAYLEERTEQALNHVRGRVPPELLATVRATLRDQLRTDPTLVELVRRATGQTPEPSPEDLSTDERA